MGTRLENGVKFSDKTPFTKNLVPEKKDDEITCFWSWNSILFSSKSAFSMLKHIFILDKWYVYAPKTMLFQVKNSMFLSEKSKFFEVRAFFYFIICWVSRYSKTTKNARFLLRINSWWVITSAFEPILWYLFNKLKTSPDLLTFDNLLFQYGNRTH